MEIQAVGSPGPGRMPPSSVRPAALPRCNAWDEQRDLICVLRDGHDLKFSRPGKPGLVEAHIDGSIARDGEVTGLTIWREVDTGYRPGHIPT